LRKKTGETKKTEKRTGGEDADNHHKKAPKRPGEGKAGADGKEKGEKT